MYFWIKYKTKRISKMSKSRKLVGKSPMPSSSDYKIINYDFGSDSDLNEILNRFKAYSEPSECNLLKLWWISFVFPSGLIAECTSNWSMSSYQSYNFEKYSDWNKIFDRFELQQIRLEPQDTFWSKTIQAVIRPCSIE